MPSDDRPPAGFGFAAYQQAAARTGGAVAVDHPFVYPTLGLANEAGEVAGKVKKIFRDRDGVITDAERVDAEFSPGALGPSGAEVGTAMLLRAPGHEPELACLMLRSRYGSR